MKYLARLILATLVLTPFAPRAFAQVRIEDAAGIFGGKQVEEVPKEVLDHARVQVLYEYLHQKNPDNPYSHETGWMTLLIGSRYSMFLDYYAYQSDSIVDAYARQGKKEDETLAPLMGVTSNRVTADRVVRSKDESWVLQSTGVATYAYREATPEIDWTLTSGDSIVAGVSCKKALTHFRGRDYIAWYAPEYQIPDGPYRFTGLPGLIFCLYDTQEHYSFTLAALRQIPEEEKIPIYTLTKPKKETREHIRQMHKNFCADPARGLMSMKGVTIPPETLATIKPLPYNPIELE